MDEKGLQLELVNNLLKKMETERLSYEEYRNLQYVLIKYSIFYKHNYPITETYLDDNPLLYVSDTHIGSSYENKKFIYNFFNYAIKNNIKTVIHMGDFIEGKSRVWNRPKEDIQNEIITALGMLPNEIKVELLFGNHDYSVFNYYECIELLDLFFKSPLNVLGLGRVKLNWCNVPIYLKHYISKNLLNISEEITNEVLTIEGHSHIYYVDELNRIIKVPSLSDELKDGSYYDKIDLVKFGYTFVPISKPYLNFIKSSIIDEDILLFEELRQNDDDQIVSGEKTLFHTKTKKIKKYKC